MEWITRRFFCGARSLEAMLDMKEFCRRHKIELDCSLPTLLKQGVENHYTFWRMPKRNGGFRVIAKPSLTLAVFQRALLEKVLYEQMPSTVAQGGVPRRGIATCIAPHVKSRSLLCVDLSDAFGSVGFDDEVSRRGWSDLFFHHYYERVEGFFGLDVQELLVLLELTHLRNKDGRFFLPQGAPTSPHLFNLALRPMHEALLRLATHTGGQVTQFFDDVFFSLPTATIPPKVRRAVFRSIEKRHLRLTINWQKVRYSPYANTANRPLRIVGSNVIEGQVSLPQEILRQFRRRAYFALKDEDEATLNGIRGYVYQVYGPDRWPRQLDFIYREIEHKEIQGDMDRLPILTDLSGILPERRLSEEEIMLDEYVREIERQHEEASQDVELQRLLEEDQTFTGGGE